MILTHGKSAGVTKNAIASTEMEYLRYRARRSWPYVALMHLRPATWGFKLMLYCGSHV
jgi:hypothetical protein